MALRLAGEEFSVVQGLDAQGRLRQVSLNDAITGLTVTQSGGGRGLDIKVPLDTVLLGFYNTSSQLVGDFYGDNSRNMVVEAARHLRLMPGAGYKVQLEAELFANGKPIDTAGSYLYNSASGYGGNVAVNDGLRIGGKLEVFDSLAGADTGGYNPDSSYRAFHTLKRTTHVADANVTEGYGLVYIYNDGAGNRQLVVKHKDGGAVYTGTVNLA